MTRRFLGLLPLLLLAGCVHSGTKIERETDIDFSRLRRIGVMTFTDNRGRGGEIADGIAAGLQNLGYETADSKALARIFAKHKPDREFGMDLETLTLIRTETSADAILFGGMRPDWSAASITMVELEFGDPVLHGVLKPGVRKQKAFAAPGEVVREALRVFGATGSESSK